MSPEKEEMDMPGPGGGPRGGGFGGGPRGGGFGGGRGPGGPFGGGPGGPHGGGPFGGGPHGPMGPWGRPPRPPRPWGWGRRRYYGGCFPWGCGCCLPVIGTFLAALVGALLLVFLL